jgi:hypothetical protein
MPFVVFMLVMITVTVVITNFFSNLATGMIIGNLVAPTVLIYIAELGVNGTVIGAALVSASMFAFLTMASCITAPLLLGKEEYTEHPSFIWTYGIATMVLGILVSWIIFTILAYIM